MKVTEGERKEAKDMFDHTTTMTAGAGGAGSGGLNKGQEEEEEEKHELDPTESKRFKEDEDGIEGGGKKDFKAMLAEAKTFDQIL